MRLTIEQVQNLREIILEDSKDNEELKNLTDEDWKNLANGIAGYYLCLFDISRNKNK